MKVTNIFIPPRQQPINTRDFANSMTNRIQSLNPGFHCGGKIRQGFIQLVAAYNHCVYMNRHGHTEQIIIPAATGTGKSKSASLYLAEIAKIGLSGLLVVSEVSVAIETAEEINKLADKKVAGVYYSISQENHKHELWHDIKDLPQIAIITHAMFIQRSDSGKDIDALRSFHGKQRDIIIIDERIDLIKRVSFETNEIADAIAILKRDDRLHAYAEILTNFNDEVFITERNGSHLYEGKFQQAHIQLREDLLILLSLLEAGKYNIVQRIRGKRRNPESDRANVKDLLRRIIYVINGRYTHIVEGNNTVCHREENLSGNFGSVVVLDATSQLNPEYDYRAANNHNILMPYRITSRDYSNVTLNICALNGPNQSKTAIYSIPQKKKKLKEIINCYLKVIGGILSPGDKLLVVTYKDVVPLFEEHNPYKDQVKFIYWGSKDASVNFPLLVP